MPYHVKLTAKFRSSYKQLSKKHYRKNPAAQKQFDAQVASFTRRVAEDPACAKREDFPAKTYIEGCELRKQRWSSLPGLNGGAQKGRLIYLVDHPNKTIYLLWIYTHAEYEKRPPDKELVKVIKGV
jgi:mRNA-degrading endonuclease RelE of RelBE toxin-antitoxin system